MNKKYLILTAATLSVTLLAVIGLNLSQETQEGLPIMESERVSVVAPAQEETQIYVTPHWVHSVISNNQAESENYVILECSVGSDSKSTNYTTGHLEGALHLDMTLIEDENNMLRSAEEIEAVFLDLGVSKDTTLILYSTSYTDIADDRAATIALWLGVDNVKCMDGGLAAYKGNGYPLETLVNSPDLTKSDFGVSTPARPEIFLSYEEVMDNMLNNPIFKTVSIRDYSEYTGLSSGGTNIKSGEIEGAAWGRSVDDGTYSNFDGSTIDLNELNRLLIPYNVSTYDNELSFHCLNGWNASVPFLVAYQEGALNVHIYDGGWIEWQSKDELPAQIGEPLSQDIAHMTVSELPK